MTSDYTPISDEVLRRIGRNLVLFQQIECCLKVLLANHQYVGSSENYTVKLEEQAESINKKMLGQLVEKYVTEVLCDAGEDMPEDDRFDVKFAFSFRVAGDTASIEMMRRDLKLMTEERNDLVHHFLPRWKPDDQTALNEALIYLDAQREKILPMHEHLKKTVLDWYQGKKTLSDFFASSEFEKQIELFFLQSSPLVCLFCAVAAQFQRKDGWTYLSQAGGFAAKELPDEVKALKKNYGVSTLKNLLVASEMFEVFDEPLVSGTFRTLYKVLPIKPENES